MHEGHVQVLWKIVCDHAYDGALVHYPTRGGNCCLAR